MVTEVLGRLPIAYAMYTIKVCICKGRRPETSRRERTEKMAELKCRTEKTAKAKFWRNTGRQNNTMCRTGVDTKNRLKCDNGMRRTARLPSSVITAECGENQVHADVAWTAMDAETPANIADDNGVRTIENNG